MKEPKKAQSYTLLNFSNGNLQITKIQHLKGQPRIKSNEVKFYWSR